MKRVLALLLALALVITCFVGCGKKKDKDTSAGKEETKVVYDVDAAAAYLKNMYKNFLTENETPADYTVISQVIRNKVVYPVTWKTNVEEIKITEDKENKQYLIDVNEKTTVDVNYELTATVSDPAGKSKSLTFKLKVPKYVLLSYSQYMAAEAGKAVVVEGYVVAIHSESEGNKYNQLYVHDVNNAGGYYVYSMGKDPVKDLGLKNGMLVSVTGTKDIYSGTHEIKDATVNILNSTPVDVKPLDITELYKNAESLKDEALTSKLAMLVTIKGVEITDQNLAEKSQYFNFKLKGLESYIRVYATDCPASVSDADMKAIIDGHTNHKGWAANVTGVVVMYGGAIYLNPVSKDCFEYLNEIKRTDAEKLQYEIDDFKIKTKFSFDGSIKLPLKGQTYEDVEITWTSDNDKAVIIDPKTGNAKVILQKEATKVTLTATLKLNDATTTHKVVLELDKMPSVAPQVVTNPQVSKAYKLMVNHETLGKLLYFKGEIANKYYFGTTENYLEAVDVYLETSGNGYKAYFMKDGAKQYLAITNDGSHTNPVFGGDASVFTFNTDHNTLVVNAGGVDCYYGAYGTYNTISASKFSYITNAGSFSCKLVEMIDTSSISDDTKVAEEKAALSIDKTEFVVDGSIDVKTVGTTYRDVEITWASDNACAVVGNGKIDVTCGDADQTVTITATLKCGSATATKTFTLTVAKKSSLVPSVVTSPEVGVAYKLMADNLNVPSRLFFNGTFDRYYLATAPLADDAADVYLETADGGYKVSYTSPDGKKYLTIAQAGDFVNAGFVDTATEAATFKFNTTYDTLTTMVGDIEYYIGVYGTYATLSASKISYLEGANSTSYASHLVTLVDTSAISDTEKVSTEANMLTIAQDNFAEDGEIDLTLNGATYPEVNITWASDNACAVVADGKLTVTRQAEKQTVTLTATLTCGEATDTKVFTITVAALPSEEGEINIENRPFIPFINQVNAGKVLYLDGTVSGKYLGMTEKKEDAVNVYLESAGEGYKLYIVNGTEKQYITMYNPSSVSLKYDAAGETVFVYNETVNAWVTNFNNTDYYIGTYKTFTTVSASKLSFINAGNTGVSQFPLELEIIPDEVTLMSINQVNAGKLLYLNGTVSGKYLGMTENFDEAVPVIKTPVLGGYKFYIVNGDEIQYITIYKYSDGKPAVKYDAAGETVFSYDAARNAWVTNFNDKDYYLGTYNNFTTTSVSELRFITPENTGNSQFPLESVPFNSIEFIMGMEQVKANKTVYLNGEVSGKYLATTENIAEAVSVYVEITGEGAKFFIIKDNEKQYITIYKYSDGKNAVKYDAAGESVFNYNAEVNAWVTVFDDVECYLGSYKTYTTISVSELSYITPSNTGVSQFPLQIALKPAGEGEGEGGSGGDNGGGEEPSATLAATFTLGTDDPTKNNPKETNQDGTEITTSAPFSETNNSYTLSLSNCSKAYQNSYDAKGNACIKLGTGSKVGKFTFTVPADVTSVKIYIAGYKDKVCKFKINGGAEQSTTKLSQNGEYDVITIDTSSNKTVSFETTSNGYRCKINTIEFYK